MRKIRIIALIASIIVASILFIYVSKFENKISEADIKYKDVVVAVNDIPANTYIKPEMLAVISVPEKSVHADSVLDYSEAEGKLSNSKIYANEVILKSRLISKGENSASYGLAYVISENSRGVSVALEAPRSVSSQLKIGNYVDIIFNGTVEIKVNDKSKTEEISINKEFTKMLLQNVKIIGLDKVITGGSDDTSSPQEYTNITFELSPEDTLKLVYAVRNGDVWLTLRPQGDNGYIEDKEIILDDIVNKARLIESAVEQVKQ
ncbi:MAG: Flp pilus assembly protein CpaB [Erysipelotrichaceae bacterium]|nr:Flp pilus assembly protein CpaB [Erysipelotrichaceae bacterium]